MRKLLNTLYLLSPNTYLQKDGENLVVRIDDQEMLRIPIHNLESVLCFSYLGASPGAMMLCVKHQVKLAFLSPSQGRSRTSVAYWLVMSEIITLKVKLRIFSEKP